MDNLLVSGLWWLSIPHLPSWCCPLATACTLLVTWPQVWSHDLVTMGTDLRLGGNYTCNWHNLPARRKRLARIPHKQYSRPSGGRNKMSSEVVADPSLSQGHQALTDTRPWHDLLANDNPPAKSYPDCHCHTEMIICFPERMTLRYVSLSTCIVICIVKDHSFVSNQKEK